MKRGFIALALLSSQLFGKVEKSFEASLKLGIQSSQGEDVAVGAYIKSEFSLSEQIKARVGLSSADVLFGKRDSQGIDFFDKDKNSYAIVNEANVDIAFNKTTLTFGRQAIDTPFVNSDDIAMMPNRYEAYSFISKDLSNTTLFGAYITKMSGIDSEEIKSFSTLDDGVFVFGMDLDLEKDLRGSFWYYDFYRSLKLSYIELNYNRFLNDLSVNFALQFAYEDYAKQEDSRVFGGAIGFSYSDLLFNIAYNKSFGGVASNGLGGGCYLSSLEHLTLSEAGADGAVLMELIEYDLKDSFEDLTLSFAHSHIDRKVKDANEYDLIFHYDPFENLSFDLIYSDIDDIKSFTNMRFFVNYSF